tara:strand:+ start:488 stop:1420 length:933 start_codon:yes stop_codon:yes gene_type:complete
MFTEIYEYNKQIMNYSNEIYQRQFYNGLLKSTIGIIGLGTVGKAMFDSFRINEVPAVYYEKFKDPYKQLSIPLHELCEMCEIIFLALPTQLMEYSETYDLSSIHETLSSLEDFAYNGIVVIKSTLVPGTTSALSSKYKSLTIFHNPEFLSEKTAFQDFHNQSNIYIGLTPSCSEEDVLKLSLFYTTAYPTADIKYSSSTETECTKIFCNSFYGAKIQIMNEFYLYAQKLNNVNFNVIKENMIQQGWINRMHTNVPGHDEQLSFGGRCLPKDLYALTRSMMVQYSPNKVLSAVCREQREMRGDKIKEKEYY